MRTRAVLVMVALAGCAPTIPESGVGFGDYSTYLRDRERALQGAPPVAPDAALPAPGIGVPPVAGGFSTELAGAAIDRAETGVAPTPLPLPLPPAPLGSLDADLPPGNAPATIRPEIGEVIGNSTISDEQDFGAVSARETIESDAERIARARAQYTVVQPTAVPQRPDDGTGPSIVAFALETTHAPGTPVYRRSGLRLNSDPVANCARYGSADLAQEDFLASGGPERDRRGIDPDGDGFVCGWDPRPFRAARP